jgi:hypothetical protein
MATSCIRHWELNWRSWSAKFSASLRSTHCVWLWLHLRKVHPRNKERYATKEKMSWVRASRFGSWERIHNHMPTQLQELQVCNIANFLVWPKRTLGAIIQDHKSHSATRSVPQRLNKKKSSFQSFHYLTHPITKAPGKKHRVKSLAIHMH